MIKMKILDSIWFTQMGGKLIGIVKVDVEYEGIKYYIGTCDGVDKKIDEKHITETGAKFPKEAAEVLFLSKLCF